MLGNLRGRERERARARERDVARDREISLLCIVWLKLAAMNMVTADAWGKLERDERLEG